MKLVTESGAWTVGPPASDEPVAAVLEVSGAVLEWTVDDPTGAAATRITITDVLAADWLWRIVGPSGHASIVAALDGGREDGTVELPEVDLLPEALVPLRRLAVGHWLRRWWPESSRDGIARLDHALLDCELAVLTAAAEEYFTEDTMDSDVGGLLAPHQAALADLERAGDPRIAGIVQSGTELAEDAGVWSSEFADAGVDSLVGRRDDYALAAGWGTGRTSGAIARGVDSVNWIAVPPGLFDAADETIEWSVESGDSAVLAVVRVATTGEIPATGIEVRVSSGAITGTGVLDADGTAALTLFGPAGVPLRETQAWDHDWAATVAAIGPSGVDIGDSAAAQTIRQRIREFARRRLASQGADAFLAEIVAAESDY